jgi:hypothetical protein
MCEPSNQLANTTTNYKRVTPDISHILMFYWFESVLYLDPGAKFPECTKSPGYFVGFAHNVWRCIDIQHTGKYNHQGQST